jgi:hypothetical protein
LRATRRSVSGAVAQARDFLAAIDEAPYGGDHPRVFRCLRRCCRQPSEKGFRGVGSVSTEPYSDSQTYLDAVMAGARTPSDLQVGRVKAEIEISLSVSSCSGQAPCFSFMRSAIRHTAYLPMPTLLRVAVTPAVFRSEIPERYTSRTPLP